MDINVYKRSCPACRMLYGTERIIDRIPPHNHQVMQYSHIIDYNSGATYVNPNPWSSHTLRIEKGKSRIDYWEE
jgi:hypothetical protein